MERYFPLLFIIFVKTVALIFVHANHSYNHGEIQYILRITNITGCPGDVKPFMSDFKWIRKGYTQYVSLNMNNEETVVVDRVMIRFERCRDFELGCEDFQTWNFTKFCHFLQMKNQVWSEIVDSVSPKSFGQYCPRFNQGIYKIQNASIDVNKLMSFYQEGIKYYWKVYGYVLSKKNELQHCVKLDAHGMSFVKRERSQT